MYACSSTYGQSEDLRQYIGRLNEGKRFDRFIFATSGPLVPLDLICMLAGLTGILKRYRLSSSSASLLTKSNHGLTYIIDCFWKMV